VCGIEEKAKEIAERMIQIALWCVLYRPELRPIMSVVVKILECSVQIPEPDHPFKHFMGEITIANPVSVSQTFSTAYKARTLHFWWHIRSDTYRTLTPVRHVLVKCPVQKTIF